MLTNWRWLALSSLLAACGGPEAPPAAEAISASARPFPLLAAAEGYRDDYALPGYPGPPEPPPAGVFEIARYPAPLGENLAYVMPARPGPPGPAVVWIHGGFSWGIGDMWTPSPRSNDQTAAAFREAGITLMIPALRGAHGSPGDNELMLGEVADVRAAGRWLASRPDVDPRRVYLAGHSTGGTIALLVAETTDQFRAVFSFGPVGRISDYGEPYDQILGESLELRSPAAWIDSVRTPTWILEGESSGNARHLREFDAEKGQAPVQTHVIPGAGHFDVLRPGCEEIARAILADTGATPAIALDVSRIRAGVTPKPTGE